jgi:hypothetical protein
MNKLMRIFSETVIAIIILAPCSLGGYLAFPLTGYPRWESLPPPLEKPVKIIGNSLKYVVVQSATGKMYACSQPYGKCWEDVRADSVHFPPANCILTTSVPDPRSGIVDRGESCLVEAEGVYARSVYALGDDGTVWNWQYPATSHDGWQPSLNGLVIGFFVGAVIWFVALIARWAKKQSRFQTRPASFLTQ